MRIRPILSIVAATAAIAGNSAAENPVVVMKTNLGAMTIELDRENAPVSVANFLRYTEEGHYKGAIFHRVIPNFMIQGGGFQLSEDGAPPRQMRTHEPILNEAKSSRLSNLRGTISMARTNDPASATSQFFINTIDNSKSLDAGGQTGPDGWAVFGKVTEGFETMDRISETKTHSEEMKLLEHGVATLHDVPLEPVIIEGVTIVSGIGEPERRTEQLAGAPLDPETLSDLGISPEGGATGLFTFFQSAGSMMVEIDLGLSGTRADLVIETSEDLVGWAPLSGLTPIPKGTSGVRAILLPDGKKKLFLRLNRSTTE